MKFSTNWLGEYVDFKKSVSVRELANILTKSGFEVESIEEAERSKKVVLATVLDVTSHPNADKLLLCQVSVGNDETKQIICGAKNFKKNDRVVVALPGARLADIKIKKAKIRGVESQGMMCSEDELGISNETDGIMILKSNAPKDGTLFDDYYQKDQVLDVNIQSNRPDTLNHFGLAREIASILNVPFNKPEVANLTKLKKSHIDVNIKSNFCPRYMGLVIKDIKIQESPLWIQKYLKHLDINTVNNVVDITNFVMLELGTPLHAFDMSKIKKGIYVSQASSSEEFVALDGSLIKLTADDLTIRDDNGILALAGVIGGQNSKVTNQTKDIFIEAACFLKEAIRKTSRRIGIETDSSSRFSKGVDVFMPELSLKRAMKLICDITGGTACGYIDNYPNPVGSPKSILISEQNVSSRLGYQVDFCSMKSRFNSIGCNVKDNKEGLEVVPPNYRTDLILKEDLIEEFARLEGFDKIPSKQPYISKSLRKHAVEYYLTKKLKQSSKSQGYNQIINYSFNSSEQEKKVLAKETKLSECGLSINADPIKLINPISQDLDSMRRSLFIGLIKSMSYNVRHGELFGRLYEVGPTFYKSNMTYLEELKLGIIAWGQKESLLTCNKTPLILDVKSDLENILRSFLVTYEWDEGVPDYINTVRGGRLVVDGKPIGYLGEIHPKFRKEFDLPHSVAGEISLDKLFVGQPRKPKLEPFSRFPKVERDISLIVDRNVKISDLIKVIKKEAGKVLIKVYPFDIYHGVGIEDSKMALGIRCVYQSYKKSLKDVDINIIQEGIVNALRLKFSAKLR